ncbi:MAG: glutamyl-tRNA amidotransferase [Bacteroidetes bacterium CG18_big_fil_WC_8_21_14_2_50_41_14]|nr:MAG: glutamyl-tRNA amidotransferase [Bacteroidetes bacterium CG18_big_fil_WC_8_21_14_2_50_41_14]PJB60049.1 MAG: glutamyl-tRNA amidotransferase [Bacteroidetes bacterium CG_4_9_14_3_um_filter_41_19]
MNLEILINNDIKVAMFAKDKRKLDALRSIKAELLLLKTGKDVTSGEIPETLEIKLLQKLVKQRKEAAIIYHEQNRPDLEEDELYQTTIIEAYLPAQLTTQEVEELVALIIKETGASSIKDMGKVMGVASARLEGKADNKTISGIVKKLLS